MSVIQTEALSHRYGKLMALDRVSLTVPENSIYALAGPNGAGKSTLFHLLLNQMEAKSGSARVLGVDSRQLGPAQYEQIGYVSESRQLPDWMTVESFFAYSKSFFKRWSDTTAEELLKAFQLPRTSKLKHLSRGQRLLATLAATWAQRPRLVLLDEPFGALDVGVRDQVIGSMIDHSTECTILIASHDLAEIESFATHFAYLKNGSLGFQGEIENLQQRFREVELCEGGSRSSFVISDFKHEGDLRQRFPMADQIAVRSLPLRSIFLELGKASK